MEELSTGGRERRGRKASIPKWAHEDVFRLHGEGHGCRKIVRLLEGQGIYATKSSVSRLLLGQGTYPDQTSVRSSISRSYGSASIR